MRTLGQCRLDGHANRFDHVRLAAAALVIISHCWPLFGGGKEPVRVLTGHVTAGEIAVAIFFVVSGFLVYRSAETSDSWMRFALARFLRIVPGVTVCALFCILVVGLGATRLGAFEYLTSLQTWAFMKNAFPIAIAYNLPGVFESNVYPKAVNGSLWTLPVEIRLYVVCGLTYYILRSRYTAPVLAVAGLLAATWILPTYGSGARNSTYWIAHYGYYFFAGSALYVWRDRIPLHGIIVAVLTALTISTLQTPFYPFAEAVMLPYTVMWLVFPDLGGRQGGALMRIPDISYGLYIYGFPVQQTVSHLYGQTLPFFACMLLSLAAATVLAVLSWYLVEKPCLKLKNRPFARLAQGQT